MKRGITFHDHLDVCVQCREQPFNLCPKGEQVLTEEAMSWEKQEAEADRREAIENEAGERATMRFASPEALKPFLEDLFEEDDLLVESEAICCMWAAMQSNYPQAIKEFEAEALSALKRLTESIFARLADDERRKIERGE